MMFFVILFLLWVKEGWLHAFVLLKRKDGSCLYFDTVIVLQLS